MLLRAFEALRGEVPAELIVIGSTDDELAPLLVEGEGVTALGRVDDAEKERALREADVLCAPSLGGESFGMVLTEAFAAGTPVVASDIAGYRDVVADGVDGLLVPRGDATRWPRRCATWRSTRRASRAWRRRRARSAERYAWPRVAEQVVEAYEDARAVPAARGRGRSAPRSRSACVPADGLPRVAARRLPSLEPAPAGARGAARRAPRRCSAAPRWPTAVGSVLAVEHIGLARIGDALVRSSPAWVLFGLALMCASMLLRAVSWHAILKAALPDARPRMVDAVQGTTIGVLMSATLPARLGEPSRALDRRAPARPRARPLAGGARHDRLADADQRARAGDPRRGDVHHDRAVRRAASRRCSGTRWRRSRCCALVLVAPALIRSGLPSRSARVARWVAQGRDAAGARAPRPDASSRARARARSRSRCSSPPGRCSGSSCYVLLVALGLEHKADLGAAAAVLFAVNVTAVLPVTPSNLGVFQAACMAVLVGAYGVAPAQALGYGIILQAVEVATAVIMGAPALVKEGLSWREVRLRALHSSPVSLSSSPTKPRRRRLKASVVCAPRCADG